MRFIRFIFFCVLFLFLAATGISLLIPSHIRISKAINIHVQKDSVFALIEDTLKWKQWHPAFMQNDAPLKFPPIHIEKQSQNDSELVMRLQQGTKIPVINVWKIYQYQPSDSLTLQWYMDFHLKWYPWQKLGSLFYENTYGTMMEQGLGNLKKQFER